MATKVGIGTDGPHCVAVAFAVAVAVEHVAVAAAVGLKTTTSVGIKMTTHVRPTSSHVLSLLDFIFFQKF